MPASNTRQCFTEFIGQKVVGTLFNALPVNDVRLSAGTKTLIFEDGRGLTIHSNGSYFIASAEEVERAVRRTEQQLRATQDELAGVLTLAGRGA